MAELTIAQTIARIGRMPKAVADRTEGLMKYYIRISTHGDGGLEKSVRQGQYKDGSYYVETSKYVGGGQYAIREVGAIIRAGRKPLWPRYKKALHWFDETGEHFARAPKDGDSAVGPAKPNDFVERTIDHVEQEIQSIWNSL